MKYKFQKEVDHLIRVLKQNGYPAKFIRNASALPTEETVDTCSCDEEQEGGDTLCGWDERGH